MNKPKSEDLSNDMNKHNGNQKIVEDNRIIWIRDRALQCLGIVENYKLFDDLIEQNNRYYGNKLLNFLLLDTYGVTDLDRKIISFYKTYRIETIQEEILVWEESHRTKITAIAAFASKMRSFRLTKSAPGKVEKIDGETKPKRIKKVKKGKGKLNDDLSNMMGNSLTTVQSIASTIESDEADTEAGSESGDNHKPDTPKTNVSKLQLKSTSMYETSSFTPPPGDENKYVLTKKIVDKVIEVPTLHMICGKVDPVTYDLKDKNVVYFLRLSTMSTPPFQSAEECTNGMMEYLSFGTIKGNCLTSLNQILIDVFRPLVSLYFEEPRSVQSREIEKLRRLYSEDEVHCPTSGRYANTQLKPIKKMDEADCKSVNTCDEGVNLVGRQGNSAQIATTMESASDTSQRKRSAVAAGPFKKDLTECLDKLISAAQRPMENLENTILSNLLTIPELMNPEITNEMLSQDENAFKKLEETIKTVKIRIEKILKSYSKKTIQNKSPPMAEYNYWNDRVAEISVLHEQLQYTVIKRVLLILELCNSPLPKEIEMLKTMILENYKEAKENRHFLSTLYKEFHFIENTDSFEEITKALPDLMEELRIVWMLSKYYCTEERMVPVMQKISWQLCQNVKVHLKVNGFGNDLSTLITKTTHAREMMITWKSAYLNTRKEIEISGKGSRWEFDRRDIFNDTEYIIKVCEDLHQMANVAQDFYNIFGDEMKSIIKIRSLVDLMLENIDELIAPIRDADFDIFIEFNKDNWEGLTKVFYTEVTRLEKKSIFYIDRCFANLVDSRESLKVLLSMQKTKTRKILHTNLLQKFDSVMLQFISEIEDIETLFEQGTKNPPILQYRPQISGTIHWKKKLLDSLKCKILFFQNVKNLANCETKFMAFECYLQLAKKMNNYEREFINKWIDESQTIVLTCMKQYVLKFEEYKRDEIFWILRKIYYERLESETIGRNLVTSKRNSRVTDVSSSSKKTEIKLRNNKQSICKNYFDEDLILLELNLRFQINMNADIFYIVQEAEFLNTIGHKLPTVLLDLCQQENRLRNDVESVRSLVTQYNNIMSTLDAKKALLLRNHLKNVERLMYPGIKRVNWNCIGIKEYCDKCNIALKDLVSVIGQIDLIIENIETLIIKEIASFNLFIFSDFNINGILKDCKTFFIDIENERNKSYENMVQKHNSLLPTLMKIEELAEGSPVEQKNAMFLFYEHYKNSVLSSFLTCFKRNLENINNILFEEQLAVFQIDSILLENTVCSNPSPEEISKLIMRNVQHLLSGIKHLSKRETVCSSEISENDDDSIDTNSNIQRLIFKLKENTQHLEKECWQYLNKWKVYENLWTQNKEIYCNDFFSSVLTLSQYDEKLGIYRRILNQINEAPSYVDFQCIRINLNLLTSEIKFHCYQWMQLIGDHLLHETVQSMIELQTKINTFSYEVTIDITNLDDFRHVMRIISNVKKLSVQAEVQNDSYQKIYNTLNSYEVKYPEEQEKLSIELKQKWENLYSVALSRLHELENEKLHYCEIIKNDIKKFSTELLEFEEDFDKNGPDNVKNDLELGLKKLKIYEKLIRQKEVKKTTLQDDEMLFNISSTDFSTLTRIRKKYENLKQIFNMFEAEKLEKEMWSDILWINCDLQKLFTQIEKYTNKLEKLPEEVRNSNVGQIFYKSNIHFKKSIQFCFRLKADAFKDRHWETLFEKTGISFDISSDRFIMKYVFNLDLASHENLVETTILTANEEADIENSIIEIHKQWIDMQLDIREHKERGYMLGSIDEINIILEDSIIKLETKSVSKFIGPFSKPVQHWISTLQTIIKNLEIWMTVQNKWLKLTGIFSKEEIGLIIPNVWQIFDKISRSYQTLMINTAYNSKVLECGTVEDRYQNLCNLLEHLETCEKSLKSYLNDCRQIFPRLYFLSNDELIDFLGGSHPSIVNKFMKKIFNNLSEILFNKNECNQIIAFALISIEGEVLKFVQSVPVEEGIEYWMKKTLLEMKRSNKLMIEEAIQNGDKLQQSYIGGFSDFQETVVNVANRVWWTSDIESIFVQTSAGENGLMKMYLNEINESLKSSIKYIKTNAFSNGERKKLDAVLTINVHFKDVVDMLIKKNIASNKDFEWQKQLRFYWIHDEKFVEVKQSHCSVEYGYEFIGLTEKLVITPLTDRIILSLLQSMSGKLGGMILGTPQTGKTATIKDLSQNLGYFHVTENYASQSSHFSICETLQGIIQCGAWGCLNDLDKVNPNELSVVSSQMRVIFSAVQEKSQHVNLEGQKIPLDIKSRIFITLNLTQKYGQQFPESIKSLFRQTVFSEPDIQFICEVKLLTNGFERSKQLARKIIAFNDLASIQLRKKVYYDFGLKSIKAMLKVADSIKQTAINLTEDAVIMGALRDVHLPKLVVEDVSLFYGILKDLFPSLSCPKIEYDNFRAVTEDVLIRYNYAIVPEQVEKIIQLYENLKTGKLIVIIGPTASGKTTIINVLSYVQSITSRPTKLSVLNPKAYTVNHLFGFYDLLTREWTDGLFNSIFREINGASFCKTEEFQFIIFDGDDGIWIENLNCITDDNRVLTLANQERIHLQDHCSLFFEVGELRYASPTMISRANVVYVDATVLGHKPYLNRWITDRPEIEKNYWRRLFEKYVDDCVSLILGTIFSQTKQPRTILPQSGLNMVTQLCGVIDALYCYENEVSSDGKMSQNSNEEIGDFLHDLLEAVFIQACYLSFGSTLVQDFRQTFDEFLKTKSGLVMFADSENNFAAIGYLPTMYHTLYDYLFNIEKKLWIPIKCLVPKYVHISDKLYSDILVPTVDTVRTLFFLDLINKIRQPLILVGDTGVSKTAIINEFLQNLDTEKFDTLSLNFSLRTTSIDLQKNIESMIRRRTLNIYGPLPGKRLIVFIDDMNMPLVDFYGTQQPIALLKLLIEKKGVYDLKPEFHWKNIKDLSFLMAVTEFKGKETNLDPRFVSLCSIYNVGSPNEESLTYIFANILSGHLECFNSRIRDISENIVAVSLNLYNLIVNTFLPIPSKFHYIFNIRDLSRMFAGLLQSDPNLYQNEQSFIRLWRNEFVRSICDRINVKKDLLTIEKCIKNAIETCWSKQPVLIEYVFRDPLLFGDFRNALKQDGPRAYEDLLDYEAVRSLISEVVENYNSKSSSKVNIILFKEALQHLTRVHRILRLQRGHVILVGMNGTGKRSLIKLAAFAAECEMFEITINRVYSEMTFYEQLKRLLCTAGVENKKVVFLLAGSQIAKESFLEAVNNILMTGIVPALFNDTEKDTIANRCRTTTESTPGISKEKLWCRFVKHCIANVHVALSMNSTDEHLRTYCRDYPSLLTRTTVNWMMPWPEEAFVSIAEDVMRNNTTIPKQFRVKVVDFFIEAYKSMDDYVSRFFKLYKRKNYVTPKLYTDSLRMYKKILDEKRNEILVRMKYLTEGLSKIAEIQATTERLSLLLKDCRDKIQESKNQCRVLVKFMQERQEALVEMKSLCAEKRDQFDDQTRMIQKEQFEIKEKISDAQTCLTAAKENIGNINEIDVSEMRSYEVPPEPVQIICESVGIINNLNDVSWSGLKDTLDDPNFLTSLQEINCDLINKKKQTFVRERLEKLTELDQVQKVSKAAYELHKYLVSVLDYCTVYKEVKLRTNKAKTLQLETENLNKKLKDDESRLKMIERELSESNVKYTTSLEEREKLEQQEECLRKRIAVLTDLNDNLSSENVRWQNEAEVLTTILEYLYGNCLISAGFLVYCGPFTCEFRNEMIYDNWQGRVLQKQIPLSQPFRIESQLCDDAEMNEWCCRGLSPDELSIQNTILIAKSSKIVLCIDPQQFAFNWIKTIENVNLKIFSHNDANVIEQVKLSMDVGSPVIIKDIDLIDPSFHQLFDDNFVHQNSRLYLLASSFNFDYSTLAEIVVIDYTTTQIKLEEELLTITMKKERPEIEEGRISILSEIHEKQFVLQQLEDELLKQITSIRDNTPDERDVIPTLDNIKRNTGKVMTKLRVAETMSADITELRDNYRSVAERGSILYFVLLSMEWLKPVYRYSLSVYLQLFNDSLNEAPADENLSRRLQRIRTVLTKQFYDYYSVGLFDEDKLLFSFEICTKLEDSTGNIFQNQIDFFIGGGDDSTEVEMNEDIKWISLSNWRNVSKLSNDFPDKFSQLPSRIIDETTEWEEWFQSETPESSLPSRYSERLSPFEALMLLRCFRVDRVCHGVMNYVTSIMGKYYATPANNALDIIYSYSVSTQPIVLFLNSASNPTSDLMKLAKRCTKKGVEIRFLSLGQNRDIVINFLEEAAKEGHWLILDHCHVSLDVMKQLENKLYDLRKPHSEFRLWFVTQPVVELPNELLQKSLKVVIEPPDGLKLKMKSLYSNLQFDSLENCPHPSYKQLVYVVAFYQSILQERNKFGKHGWNLTYDFSVTDFEDSITILNDYLTKSWRSANKRVPWTELKYLIGEIIYGGKIYDKYDSQISMIYLENYFGDTFHSYQTYHLYSDKNFDYKLPPKGDVNSCLKLIETFPIVNSSQVIGLHSNADFHYYSQRTEKLWEQLRNLQPQTSDICAKNNDDRQCDVVEDICESILNTLSTGFDLQRIKRNFGLNVTPLKTVLFQELEQVNALIQSIRSTLIQLKKAISGTIQLDENLEENMISLYKGKLPREWANLAPESSKKLADWLNHFERRIIQYTYWAGAYDPIVIWLSGLHYPKSYLAAVMQIACRKNNWRLENASMQTEVTCHVNAEEIEERPDYGCYIEGLYLQNARWDGEKQCLVKCYNNIVRNNLPVLAIQPTERKLIESKISYKTPVYETPNRVNSNGNNVVFEADLKINEDETYWILQRVCLLLNEN